MKIWKAISFYFFRGKPKKKKNDLKKHASFDRPKDQSENIKTDQSKIYHVNEIDQNSRCRICLDLG